MRKLFKKLSVLSVAAVLAAGTLSLAACGPTVKVAPDTSATKESVTSNGGFVVTTGDYYYFINGVQDKTLYRIADPITDADVLWEALKQSGNSW